MKAILVDVDYIEGVSLLPNPWVMKTSSFLKQKGVEVVFSRRLDVVGNYDRLFIFKEKDSFFAPSPSVLLEKRTRLVGEYFNKLSLPVWDIPVEIYAARPDYSLYSVDYVDAGKFNFAATSYKDRVISIQDYKRSDTNRADLYIIDRDIWDSDNRKALIENLSQYSRIRFYHPVKLHLLNEDEVALLSKLRYAKGYRITCASVDNEEDLARLLSNMEIFNKLSRVAFNAISINVSPFYTKKASSLENLQLYKKALTLIDMVNQKQRDMMATADISSELYELFEPFVGYRNSVSFFEYYCGGLEKINSYAYNEKVNFIFSLKRSDEEIWRLGFSSKKGNTLDKRKVRSN